MTKSKADLFSQAMKNAAWTVKNGTREERSGRFLLRDRLVVARDAKTGAFVNAKNRTIRSKNPSLVITKKTRGKKS